MPKTGPFFFTPVKNNGPVDVTYTRAIMHQKHLAQSGHSTRSAVDIVNTLHGFTEEPIRGQEIKLECMKSSIIILTFHQFNLLWYLKSLFCFSLFFSQITSTFRTHSRISR